jgi:ADP-ribose pyrophosphatase
MVENTFKPQFNQHDVEIDSVQPCFEGFFKINKFRFRHKMFGGGMSQWVEREIFERGDAVAILPYDPVRKKVILVEQIRIGALRNDANSGESNPWLLEIIAGMVDKQHESLEEVATREAHEEANLDILELTPMLNYLSSPGGTTERLYLYLGIVDSTNTGGVYGLPEENEDIKVHVFDVDDVFEMVEQGVIDNAAAVISLQWLQLNQHKL